MSLGRGLKFGGKIMTDEEISAQAESGQDVAATNQSPGTTRRSVLQGSVAGIAVAGAMALSGCGPENEPEGEGSSPAEKAGGNAGLSTGHGITATDIQGAERVMGLAYTRAERRQVLTSIDDQIDAVIDARKLRIPLAVAPAMAFDPRLPGKDYGAQANAVKVDVVKSSLPAAEEDIAFASLTHLAHWVRTRQISSRELTELYLARIARYAPKLECFVTVTGDLARAQAAEADAEIATGSYRGPLHGIPYAMKDLMDTSGIRTTWGAVPYKDRIASTDGVVTSKLRDAGAVLLGKTTLGALAYGDIWFGGQTRNPWNIEEGSSGSSAGAASSTAAGLVGFSIGTETWGSIVEPANRCGVTGLRPTFGRVPRTGAMPLSWSMDKIGTICRSVEDTALVLAAINGFDVSDPSSLDVGFEYDGGRSARDLRVGYIPAWFEDTATDVDRAALEAARSAGLDLVEVDLPDLPYASLGQILAAESASAFEELTLSGRDDELRWQEDVSWPNYWRSARLVSAVDLVNIDRFRRQVMGVIHDLFTLVDALIGPTYGGNMGLVTNCTGQPELSLRAGFVKIPSRALFGEAPQGDGAALHRVPFGFSVWGPLFGEENVLLIGKVLDAELGAGQEHPTLKE